MQAPVGTPVIEKKAKDLMVSEMVVINGVTCQLINVIPHIEGAPFITVAVTAEGLREWEQVIINIPAEQKITVAMPACSPAMIEQTKAVQAVVAQQEAVAQAQAEAPVAEAQEQKKASLPHQYYETDQGYYGYL